MSGAVLTRVRQTIVVTLQGDADSETLAAASIMLTEELQGHAARGVVFEVSGCEVIDVDEFSELLKLIQRVEWLGVTGVIAGLRPGLVAYLIAAGVSANAVRATRDLDRALFEIDRVSEM